MKSFKQKYYIWSVVGTSAERRDLLDRFYLSKVVFNNNQRKLQVLINLVSDLIDYQRNYLCFEINFLEVDYKKQKDL